MMVSNWSELDFIRSLSQKDDCPDEDLILGIGDDCAILNQQQNNHTLVTTDMLVEGVHFDLSWHPPEKLGMKCVAVNLSDIAAMGGVPKYAFISIAIPPQMEKKWLDRWTEGVMFMLRSHNCKLVGGDTVKGNSLTVNITIFGSVEKDKAILRSNAKPGQSIFVSGPIGSAAAGLELFLNHQQKTFFSEPISDFFKEQHLAPIPEVELGKLLAKSQIVTAMQDVSDGIATDLAHICEKSRVKAIIEQSLLPCHVDLPEIAKLTGKKLVDLQVSGGDDYRLIFTVEKGQDQTLLNLLNNKGFDHICRIGVTAEGEGVTLNTVEGDDEISFKGFEHQALE